MTRPSPAPRRLDDRGFGLIDLLAAVTVVAILAGMGVAHFDQRRQDINTTLRQVSADLRWARGRAMVAGEHFRFHRTSDSTYEIQRLEEVDGEWEVKAVVRTVALPAHISLTGSDEIDIDGRGTVVFADAGDTAPSHWTLTDTEFATTRSLTLYPSGQVDANG